MIDSPEPLHNGNHIREYGRGIIDATFNFVGAYKINPAFYEAEGPDGLAALEYLIDYIRDKDERIPVIFDGKRTDVGNTNRYYVKALRLIGADAITVNPYFGGESLGPFLDQKDLEVFVLCRTSNSGAGEFQDKISDGKPLYMHVAEAFVTEWNTNGNCGLVVGATHPRELARIRENYPRTPLLVPGVGIQGGDLEETVKAARWRMLINAGRHILYASSWRDYAEAAGNAARQMHEDILRYLP
jgi:orotidine-5'-phosphate decarboxylase